MAKNLRIPWLRNNLEFEVAVRFRDGYLFAKDQPTGEDTVAFCAHFWGFRDHFHRRGEAYSTQPIAWLLRDTSHADDFRPKLGGGCADWL